MMLKRCLRFILDLCLHPRVMRAVSNLLGPNVVLFSSTLFTKYPPKEKTKNYSGDFVGWHQDLKYWGIVNLKPKERVKVVSMWLAIDQVSTVHIAEFASYKQIDYMRCFLSCKLASFKESKNGWSGC